MGWIGPFEAQGGDTGPGSVSVTGNMLGNAVNIDLLAIRDRASVSYYIAKSGANWSEAVVTLTWTGNTGGANESFPLGTYVSAAGTGPNDHGTMQSDLPVRYTQVVATVDAIGAESQVEAWVYVVAKET